MVTLGHQPGLVTPAHLTKNIYQNPKIFAELDLDTYITSVPPPSSALGHRRVRCCAGWQHWRFYPLKTCSPWCPLPLFGFLYEACHFLENRVSLQLTTFNIFMKGRNEWGKHNFITWLKHCCWWPVSAGGVSTHCQQLASQGWSAIVLVKWLQPS